MPQSFKDLGVTSRPLPVRTRMFGRAWPLRAPVRDGRVPSWQELAAANNFPSVMCMVSTSIVTFQPLLFCFSTSTICSVFWFPSSLFTYIWLVVCIKIQKFYKIVKQCKRKKNICRESTLRSCLIFHSFCLDAFFIPNYSMYIMSYFSFKRSWFIILIA